MSTLKRSSCILLTAFSISLTSCDWFGRINKGIVFEAVSAESLLSQENKSLLGKGPVWETWSKLHKACLTSQFFKKPTYLGLSNTVDLGSIYSKDGRVLKWDFKKLFSDTERRRVINSGQPQPCSYTEQLAVDFQSFISTELPTAGFEGELSTAIRNTKDISVNIDNWQIDNLVTGELKHLLTNPSTPQQREFKEDLLSNRLLIVAQAARVNGFSALINLQNDVSTNLEAELKKGLVKNLGNTEAEIKFTYVSARQIKVTSRGTFNVFVEFVRANRVNE